MVPRNSGHSKETPPTSAPYGASIPYHSRRRKGLEAVGSLWRRALSSICVFCVGVGVGVDGVDVGVDGVDVGGVDGVGLVVLELILVLVWLCWLWCGCVGVGVGIVCVGVGVGIVGVGVGVGCWCW